MSTQTSTAQIEPLALQLGFNADVMRLNSEGISQEDSLIQPQPAGNCLNWVVGHILYYRNDFLKLLGRQPIWNEEQASRYRDQPITEADEAMPLSDLLALFERSQGQILDAMKEAKAEQLAEEIDWFGGKVSIAAALAGLVFHEAYHAGQMGILRRIAGKPGAVKLT